MAYFVLAAALLSAISWFSAIGLVRRLHSRGRSLWIVTAGLLPTALIIIGLAIWDHFAWQEYLKGPRDGYMSPLVFLLYGFPFLLGNLVMNLAAAAWAGRRIR